MRTDDVIVTKVTCENTGDCKCREAMQNYKFTYEKIDHWLPISYTCFNRGGQAFLFSIVGNAIELMEGKVRVIGKIRGNPCICVSPREC